MPFLVSLESAGAIPIKPHSTTSSTNCWIIIIINMNLIFSHAKKTRAHIITCLHHIPPCHLIPSLPLVVSVVRLKQTPQISVQLFRRHLTGSHKFAFFAKPRKRRVPVLCTNDGSSLWITIFLEIQNFQWDDGSAVLDAVADPFVDVVAGEQTLIFSFVVSTLLFLNKRWSEIVFGDINLKKNIL